MPDTAIFTTLTEISKTFVVYHNNTHSDEDNFKIKITTDIQVTQRISMKYLINFTKVSTLAKYIKISFKEGYPIQFVCDTDTGTKIKYFIAPKINNEDE
mmetsp:Transcript_19189/g.28675  ORF Transcript_19189/g.28675 Transcript_19189/m.28675 type:complete len:99 (+) Transcript_19189:498-794(+)